MVCCPDCREPAPLLLASEWLTVHRSTRHGLPRHLRCDCGEARGASTLREVRDWHRRHGLCGLVEGEQPVPQHLQWGRSWVRVH